MPDTRRMPHNDLVWLDRRRVIGQAFSGTLPASGLAQCNFLGQAEVIDFLNRAVRRALAAPAVKGRLAMPAMRVAAPSLRPE